MAAQMTAPTFKPMDLVSFAMIYAAIQASEADPYHLDILRATGAPWPQTLADAVRQHAPLAGGGFMSLQGLLTLLCVPATVGRAHRMLDMVRSKGFDWQTAFVNTREDKQAESGGGKRTRAYERVKKARQRLINGVENPMDSLTKSNMSDFANALSPQDLTACVHEAFAWHDKGELPDGVLCALTAQFVAEAGIDSLSSLSQAANAVLREAALRFVALQTGLRADQQ
jgi:hypothetical protein